MPIALLAPVPEEHLLAGRETCTLEGKVAFGSKNWELFYKLAELLEGEPCEALLYVSDASQPVAPPSVMWRATYTGFVQSKGGAHPDGMKYRPSSTAKYHLDNQGSWAVFWEVTDLLELEREERIRIGQLRGFDKPNKYLTNFIPKGPVLIQEPLIGSGSGSLKVVPS